MSESTGRVGLVSDLLRRGISPVYADVGIPVINQKCIRPQGVLDLEYSRRHDEEYREIPNELLIQPGDILINSTGTGTLGRSCVVEDVKTRMTWDSHVTLVRPRQKEVCPSYLGWVIFSEEERFIELSVGSTNQIELSRGTVFNLPMRIPPLAIQRRIAEYLNRETAEIDAAVIDLDRYVELLEKRRRAIAVSAIFPHGFPENLLSAQSFLDLGYESVIRIGSFAKLRRIPNSDQDAQYLSLMKGIGVIPYEEKGNVGNKKPQDLSDTFLVEAGDYLVNSMNFKIGSFGRSRYAGVASGAYLIFSIDDEIVNPDFLQYVFENDDLRAQAQNLGNGILEHRKSINWDRFRSIYLPYPSREEQDGIVEFLCRETAEIDDLIAESTKLRELLLKRRSVLITEVVTGRKQV
jgi:restriction endonuclease S subunit